jgi:hypothetical protein
MCKKKDTRLMHGMLRLGPWTLFPGKRMPGAKKGGSMKKLFVVAVLAMSVAVPSFGSNVVGHSAKAARKVTYKAGKENWQGRKSSCEVPFLR